MPVAVSELAVSLVAAAIALIAFLTINLQHASTSLWLSKIRFARRHSRNAIHPDEVFFRGEGQQTVVLEFDSQGFMRDIGAEASLADMPTVGTGSTRLTLIGLEAQGEISAGIAKPNQEGTHLYHYERLLTTSSFSGARMESSSFDPWDLLRLWSPSKCGGTDTNYRPWHISIGVLGSFIESRVLSRETLMSKNWAFVMRPHFIDIWECLSTIQTRTLSGGGTEVICCFETLPFNFVGGEVDIDSAAGAQTDDRSDEKHHVRQFSPLKDHFHRLVFSKSAASSIARPNAEVAVMLVVIDILRATMECWIVHLTQLSQRTLRMPTENTFQDPGANFESLQKLRAVPRDLQAALDLVFDTMAVELEGQNQKVAVNTTLPLRKIRLEANAKLQSIRHSVEDLIQRFEFYSDTISAHAQRDQASSVQRLTLLATIFLPISLATGILSMGSRAVDLGAIWFDFFGVSLILVATVTLVYQAMHISNLFYAKWDAIVASSLHDSRNDSSRTTVDFSWLLINFIWKQLRRLSFTGLFFSVCKLAIPIPFFLLFGKGMFDSIDRSTDNLELHVAAVSLGLAVVSFVYGCQELIWVWRERVRK